jgi:hypothetical protein
MDMEKMQAYWAEQNEARRKATLENLKTTTAALQKLGVELVQMTYSGGGDSGDYHYPIYTVGGEELEDQSGYGESSYQLDSSGEFSSEVVVSIGRVGHGLTYEKGAAVYGPVPTSREEMGLCEAVSDLLQSTVSDQYGGWENNKGAEGTVTFDVKEGTILVEHGSHVMETVWDSYSVGGETSTV